jgi:hypothetical protein
VDAGQDVDGPRPGLDGEPDLEHEGCVGEVDGCWVACQGQWRLNYRDWDDSSQSYISPDP